MFGIGTSEILIIMLIALLVLGPKEIPKIARTLGRGLREIERAKDELKQSIEFEVDDKDPGKKTELKETKPEDEPEPSEDLKEEMDNLPSNRV